MRQSSFKKNLQQSILYIVVALLIPLLAYEGLIFDVSTQFSLNMEDISLSYPYVLLVTVFPLALFLSGVLSFAHPNLASRIALVSSTVGLGGFLIVNCVIFLTISIFLVILPRAFMAFVLPALLLFITATYSRWTLRSKEQNGTVLGWLINRQGASDFTKSLVVITIVICALQFTVQLLMQQSDDQNVVYRMTWETQSEGTCLDQINLQFVDAYGYQILACSEELAEYLGSVPDDEIEVTFTQHYSKGTWIYEIEKVGSWHGSAKYYGLTYSCSSNDDPKCKEQNYGPPLRQPYFIVEAPDF